jgi:hypothetical protein
MLRVFSSRSQFLTVRCLRIGAYRELFVQPSAVGTTGRRRESHSSGVVAQYVSLCLCAIVPNVDHSSATPCTGLDDCTVFTANPPEPDAPFPACLSDGMGGHEWSDPLEPEKKLLIASELVRTVDCTWSHRPCRAAPARICPDGPLPRVTCPCRLAAAVSALRAAAAVRWSIHRRVQSGQQVPVQVRVSDELPDVVPADIATFRHISQRRRGRLDESRVRAVFRMWQLQ